MASHSDVPPDTDDLPPISDPMTTPGPSGRPTAQTQPAMSTPRRKEHAKDKSGSMGDPTTATRTTTPRQPASESMPSHRLQTEPAAGQSPDSANSKTKQKQQQKAKKRAKVNYNSLEPVSTDLTIFQQSEKEPYTEEVTPKKPLKSTSAEAKHPGRPVSFSSFHCRTCELISTSVPSDEVTASSVVVDPSSTSTPDPTKPKSHPKAGQDTRPEHVLTGPIQHPKDKSDAEGFVASRSSEPPAAPIDKPGPAPGSPKSTTQPSSLFSGSAASATTRPSKTVANPKLDSRPPSSEQLKQLSPASSQPDEPKPNPGEFHSEFIQFELTFPRSRIGDSSEQVRVGSLDRCSVDQKGE